MKKCALLRKVHLTTRVYGINSTLLHDILTVVSFFTVAAIIGIILSVIVAVVVAVVAVVVPVMFKGLFAYLSYEITFYSIICHFCSL